MSWHPICMLMRSLNRMAHHPTCLFMSACVARPHCCLCALLPSSLDRWVLDRSNNSLVNCTKELCKYAQQDTTLSGRTRWVNRVSMSQKVKALESCLHHKQKHTAHSLVCRTVKYVSG
jgi:hypothetical protein